MLNCQQIKAAVAAHYGIPLGDLEGRSMFAEHARPRQVAMALSRQMIPCLSPRGRQGRHISFMQIGRRFHRDHSTAIHAVRTVERLCLTDSVLRNAVDSLSVGLLLEPLS